jgi:hypothetical protein
MDNVGLADAKIALVAGMTAVLLQVDSEEALQKIFNNSLDAAKAGYIAHLNETIRARNATGMNVEILTGPAGTRELWIGNIIKLFPLMREKGVREFFEVMLKRAMDRMEEQKAKTT